MAKSKLSLKPLFDNLVIEPNEQETTLPSGIVIPDTASKEKPQRGTVIAVGPGKRDENGDSVKMMVKNGDDILFKKWGGTEIKVDGVDYLIIKEEDVLAIYE